MSTQPERRVCLLLSVNTETLRQIEDIASITKQNMSQIVETALNHLIQLEDDMKGMEKFYYG